MPVKTRVGLQLHEIDSGYARDILRGIAALCRERDAQLIIFSGNSPGWPYGHEYQKTAAFSHISPVNVDVLVIAAGTQCNFISTQEFDAMFRSLAPLPVVSVGAPIGDVPSILIDNRTAFRALLDHLSAVHGYESFVFIGGSRTNVEARERRETFESFLRDHGLPVDPMRILTGDFSSESGYRALEQCFGHHRPDCDAIVCANDNMALGAYRYLEELGLRAGRDVAVTGFDDMPRARFETPPLTTVRQDVYLQAFRAGAYALDLLAGKPVPPETRLPAEPVVRASCGCLSGTIAGLLSPTVRDDAYEGRTAHMAAIRDALASLFAENPLDFPAFIRKVHELIEGAGFEQVDPRHWNLILNDLFREFLPVAGDPAIATRMHIAFQGARSLVAELFYADAGLERYRMGDDLARIQDLFSRLNAVMPLDDLLGSLRKIFKALGVDSAALVLYRRRITRLRGAPFELPGEAELALHYAKDGHDGLDTPRRPFNPRIGLLPAALDGDSGPECFVVRALYHQFDQLGYLVLSPGAFGLEHIEFLCSLVSSALESSLLYTEKLELESRLGGFMRDDRSGIVTIDDEAFRDGLTGLYNRRGFVSFTEQIIDIARRMRKGGVILFAEVGDLSRIYERHGVESGDRAVREAAKLLKNAFRNLDVVARVDSGQFGVLALDVEESTLEAFERRVLDLVDAWNARSKAPFRLSLTVGAVELPLGGDYRLESLFASAVKILEHRKEERRAGHPEN